MKTRRADRLRRLLKRLVSRIPKSAKQRGKIFHQRVNGALGCRIGWDRADNAACRERRDKNDTASFREDRKKLLDEKGRER
jgi:hypothetical protein